MLKVLSVDGVFDEAGLKEWGQIELSHGVSPLLWRKASRIILNYSSFLAAPGGNGVQVRSFIRWPDFLLTILVALCLHNSWGYFKARGSANHYRYLNKKLDLFVFCSDFFKPMWNVLTQISLLFNECLQQLFSIFQWVTYPTTIACIKLKNVERLLALLPAMNYCFATNLSLENKLPVLFHFTWNQLFRFFTYVRIVVMLFYFLFYSEKSPELLTINYKHG